MLKSLNHNLPELLRLVRESVMFGPVDALICETLKTYCYENDFTLPNTPTPLTVISDVIGAFTAPRLNLGSALRSGCAAGTGGF